MKIKLLLLSFLFILKLNAQVDTIPPVITMNGPDTVSSAVFMHYTDLGATAFDLKDGIVAVAKTSMVDTMHIGTYLVTYNAVDAAGNQAIPKMRIVMVRDTVRPNIQINGPNPLILCKGSTSSWWINDWTVSDNYYSVGALTISVSYINFDVNRYSTNDFYYSVIDPSGNVTVIKRTIIVDGNCIFGSVFFDKNNNCNYDSSEIRTGRVNLIFKNVSTSATMTASVDYLGHFGINSLIDSGLYLVKVIPLDPIIKTTCGADSFYYHHDSSLHFIRNIPLYDTLINDLSISFIPFNSHRWNFTNELAFTIRNLGNITVENSKVQLKIPNQVTILSSSPAYDSISNNVIYWQLDSLLISERDSFRITYKADTAHYHLNDTIAFYVNSNNQFIDIDTANNSDVLKKRVVGSYDPNEKYCIQPKILKSGTTDFNYTVLFQNTGNAEALDVVVKDTIDSRFDINTLQIKEASHLQRMYIKDNVLIVRFEAIFLPDSHSNEPKSHGFFSYTVKLKKPLALNEEIKNTAYIYFDNNPAIVTNTTSNKYILSGINSSARHVMVIYPNPAKSIVNIQNEYHEQIALLDLLGKELLTTTSSAIDISGLPKGVYIVRLNNSYTKLIKE